MSRILTLLAALLVVIAAFLLLRNNTVNHKTSSPAQDAPDAKPVQNNAHFLTWREFEFKPGRFKVLLPALPQHVSDTVTDPKTKEPRKYETFATASDNGSAFIVNAITYASPFEAQANEDYLKEAVTEMLSRNTENKLNNMKAGTFRGRPALDFSMNNGDMLIEGKILTHHEVMYILSMLSKKEAFNKDELNYFINSFQFIDEEQPAANKKLPETKTEVPAPQKVLLNTNNKFVRSRKCPA